MTDYHVEQIIEVVLYHTVEADSKDDARDQVNVYGIDEAILYSDEYDSVVKTAKIQDA